jgi:hypothetical protein
MSEYQPPPGPPPGKTPAYSDPPPPYHDWTIIPDNSQLPPPPGISHELSSGANATKYEADRAAKWCSTYPLWAPRGLSYEQLHAIHNQNHILVKAQTYIGDLLQDFPAPGLWKCRTANRCTDSLIQTALPIYSAPADSPLVTERTKTIYFEVKIVAMGIQGPPEQKVEKKHGLFSKLKHREPESQIEDAGIAIGFFAPPYPSFRLPGWQRGSLGVHSDDGRRYVNDTHGGMDFTQPFQAGDTVGIGMTFRIPVNPPAYGVQGHLMDVEVFFTRNGKMTGGWDLHEEQDQLDQGVQGLEGDYDIFPAVGVFGGCDFEINFKEKDWLYHPSS